MIVYHIVGNEWQMGQDLLSSAILGKEWQWKQPKEWNGIKHDKYVHTFNDYDGVKWFVKNYWTNQERVLEIDLPDINGIITDKWHTMVPDRIKSEWIKNEMPLLP